MAGHPCLVIADDLTGATDTGHEFARRGANAVVVMDEDVEPDDASIVVANTDSRYGSPSDAGAAVAAAVERYPANAVYKKVDSTLRGNLTAEIDAALRAADADCAVVAPAFPANGRVTACGYHLVEGEHVTETTAGRDPDAPVRTSHLPSLLAESTHPVEHLGIEAVARGPETVRETLTDLVTVRSEPPLVACDATHEDHLDAIAAGVSDAGLDVVYAGSAGLAGHVRVGSGVGEQPGRPRSEAELVPTASGPALGIAGSVSETTLSQVAAVPRAQVVPLDVRAAIRDPAGAGREAAERAVSVLSAHGSAVVTSARSHRDVEAAMEAGRRADVPESDVRTRLARALGAAAAEVWNLRPPSGLFLTGGAIAMQVLARLEADALRLTGAEIETGIPISEAVGGAADGTPIVTKAGAFGREETIVNCLDCLRGDNDGS